MLSVALAVTTLVAVYVLPGFALAQYLGTPLRRNPLVWAIGSMVFVPLVVAAAGGLGAPLERPEVAALLLASLTGILLALAFVARRIAPAGVLDLPAGPEHSSATRRLVAALVGALVALVAAFHLSQAIGHQPTTHDAYVHVQKIVSIFATGLPPSHYRVVDASLAYYFGDFIAPAMTVLLSDSAVPATQAYPIHAVLRALVIGAFLAWLTLRIVPPGWAAPIALALLLFNGGVAALAGPSGLLAWLPPAPACGEGDCLDGVLTAQSPFILAANPRHLSALGAGLAAVVVLTVARGAGSIRAILAGALLAFCVASSVWVAIAMALSFAVWGLWGLIGGWSPLRPWQWVLCALTSLVLVLPFLPSLLVRNKGLLRFDFLGGSVLEGLRAAGVPIPPPPWPLELDILDRLLSGPLNLALVFGLPGLLALAWLLRERGRLTDRPLVAFMVAGLLAFSVAAWVVNSAPTEDLSAIGLSLPRLSAALLAGLWLADRTRPGVPVASAVALLLVVHVAAGLNESRDDFAILNPLPAHAHWIDRNTPLDSVIFWRGSVRERTAADSVTRQMVVQPGNLSQKDLRLLGPTGSQSDWSPNRNSICRVARSLNLAQQPIYLAARPGVDTRDVEPVFVTNDPAPLGYDVYLVRCG